MNPNNTSSSTVNSLNISPEIKVYLEGLLEDAGIQTVDELMKEEMIKELYARLDNFLTTTIIDNMPPDHLDTFIKMNEEKKSKEEIEMFLKEKMTNYKEVFSKAFADFRDLYLGGVTASRNAPDTKKDVNNSN